MRLHEPSWQKRANSYAFLAHQSCITRVLNLRSIEASNLFEESVNMNDLSYNHESLGFYGRADRGSLCPTNQGVSEFSL